jgi:CheY-like chemotaxis protein
VVILTGSDEGDDGAARAMRLGASGYLTKPPKAPQTVVLAVGRALERKRERDGQRLRLH